MSEGSDKDIDWSRVLDLMREEQEKQRGYADFHKWSLDRTIEERSIARKLLEHLSLDIAKLRHRGQGNDPPDCEATLVDGRKIGIEVTELVCREAVKLNVKAKKANDPNGRVYAQWEDEDLIAAVQERIQAKDAPDSVKGGPFSKYILAMHTGEPMLDWAWTAGILGSTPFDTVLIDEAYLVMPYCPKAKRCPVIPIQIRRKVL